MRIILASGSPRRRELLAQAGYTFEIEVSDADEHITADSPGEMVEKLAFRKAEAVAQLHLDEEEPCIVIGADTIVTLEGDILGKPEGEQDAMRMLSALSGRTHQVYTGVAIFLLWNGESKKNRIFHECTDVMMRELTEEEICRYIAAGEPMDKAGAYGIQGKAAVFVSGIRGDYYNVVGLPVCHTAKELEELLRFASRLVSEINDISAEERL